jgi:hypothetical protein
VVAKAILHCAVVPERDVYVGGASRATAWFGQRAPRLYDRLASLVGVKAQLTRQLHGDGDALYDGAGSLRERSGRNGKVRERSLYTDARIDPPSVRGVAMGVAALLLLEAGRRYVRSTRRQQFQ